MSVSMQQQVADYQLLNLLAEGGMSQVFRAEHRNTKQLVAMKISRLDRSSERIRETILREIQAMARLSHPHVLPILDWGEDERVGVWVVMPIIEHQDLAGYATEATALHVLERIDELLDALSYVHDRGIIHKDIKPKNLLIEYRSPQPHLWLTDFGVASVAREFGLQAHRSSFFSTIIGTPAYMAPEHLRGDPDISHVVDLYAVGITLYTLFEGRRPYDTSTLIDVSLGRRTIRSPVFTARSAREIPDGLQAIIDRLVTQDPYERFASAAEVRRALSPIISTLRTITIQSLSEFSKNFILSADGATEPLSLASDETGPLLRCPQCGRALASAKARCVYCKPLDVTPSSLSLSATRLSFSTIVERAATKDSECTTIAIIALLFRTVITPAVLRILQRSGALIERLNEYQLTVALPAALNQSVALINALNLISSIRTVVPLDMVSAAVTIGDLELTAQNRFSGKTVLTALQLVSKPTQGVWTTQNLAPSLRSMYEWQASSDHFSAIEITASTPNISVQRYQMVALSRSEELQFLTNRAQTVQEKSIALGAQISAKAGAGKSALIQTFINTLSTDKSWVTLSGSANKNDFAEPLCTIIQILRNWFGSTWVMSNDEVSICIASKFNMLGIEASALLVNSLTELLSSTADGITQSAAPNSTGRVKGFDTVGSLIELLSTRYSVLLAIDDFHWVDPSTPVLLHALLERLRQHRLFVVLGTRQPEVVIRQFPVIELGELLFEHGYFVLQQSSKQSTLLPAYDSQEARTWYAKLHGSPFYLCELGKYLRTLQDQGLTLDSLQDYDLPQIQARRFLALDATAQRYLQLAAVMGPQFFPAVVEYIGEFSAEECSVCLQALSTAALVVRTSEPTTVGLVSWNFAHDLVWQQVYATLTTTDRASIHHAVATAFENFAKYFGSALLFQLGSHWKSANQPVRASAWYFRAGLRAEGAGAISEAFRCYQEAWELLSPYITEHPDTVMLGIDYVSLLSGLARTALETGELTLAKNSAQQVIDCAQQHRVLPRADAYRVIADIARSQAQPDASIQWIDRALGELGNNGDRLMRALLLGRRGWVLGYVLGRNDEGSQDVHQALSLLSGLDVPGIESQIYSFLGANELRAGRWDAQRECNHQALRLAEIAVDLAAQGRANINLGVCYTNRGDLPKAIFHTQAALTIATRTGQHRMRIVAVNNLGILKLDLGDLTAAEQLLTECIALCERFSITDILHETLPSLGRLRLLQNQIGTAKALCIQGKSLSEQERNPVGIALALRVLALCAAHTGDIPTAIEHLETALTVLGTTGDAYEIATTDLCLGLIRREPITKVTHVLTELGANPELEIARWSVPTLQNSIT